MEIEEFETKWKNVSQCVRDLTWGRTRKDIFECTEMYKNVPLAPYPRQYIMLLEECSELIHAMVKYKITYADDYYGRMHILEEAADVIIAIEAVRRLVKTELSQYDCGEKPNLPKSVWGLVYEGVIETYNGKLIDIGRAFQHIETMILELFPLQNAVSKVLRGERSVSLYTDVLHAIPPACKEIGIICGIFQFGKDHIKAAVIVKSGTNKRIAQERFNVIDPDKPPMWDPTNKIKEGDEE